MRRRRVAVAAILSAAAMALSAGPALGQALYPPKPHLTGQLSASIVCHDPLSGTSVTHQNGAAADKITGNPKSVCER